MVGVETVWALRTSADVMGAKMTMVRPNAFLIGAARSGTSFVAHSLATNDAIGLSQPKEPHFMAFADQELNFSGPADDTTINLYSITKADEYAKAFGAVASSPVLLDASVTALYYHGAAVANIGRYGSAEPRFVVIIRDPVERAYSNFMYQRGRGFEPLEDFRAALEAESERRDAGWQHMFHYKALSDYAEGIHAFREAFGTSALLVLSHDEVMASPLDSLNRMCRHFEAPEFEALPIPHAVNSSGSARFAFIQSLQTKLREYPDVRRRLRSVVPIRQREMLRRANLQRVGLAASDASDLRSEWRPIYDALEAELGSLPSSWEPA